MATQSRGKQAAKSLTTLVVLLVVIFGTLGFGIWQDKEGAEPTPGLALDLQGGVQMILTPKPTGDQQVTEEVLNQAIAILRQRVDASGVAEAEITSEGGRNIVVALPGSPSEDTLDLVLASAQMYFRPVLAYTEPGEIDPDSLSNLVGATLGQTPENAWDPAWIDAEVAAQIATLDCTVPENLTGGQDADPAKPLVSCSNHGLKYVLGPVVINGSEIDSASAQLAQSYGGGTTNNWLVVLNFKSEGAQQFRDVTSALAGLTGARNQFAMVLDGIVISAPSVNEVIPNGEATISGNFTRADAHLLANQLNFGALPMTFELESQEPVSATLGAEQLEKSLIAGLIGLLLVVIYSVFQYRALSIVTLGSLLIAAVTAYGTITLLSWLQGFTLSLAGVAGLIIAIGITADSFIVYFERIRDELREGKPLHIAVERGWERARRTILASDAVNFLAAIVLYTVAVGGVRGFAFTLGLTTLIDLAVVFLFTHPVVTLLARTKFFGGGHPASGLDPYQLGATKVRYAGRGRFVQPKFDALDAQNKRDGTAKAAKVKVRTSYVQGSHAAPADGLTIAERKALQTEQEQEIVEEVAANEGAEQDGER